MNWERFLKGRRPFSPRDGSPSLKNPDLTSAVYQVKRPGGGKVGLELSDLKSERHTRNQPGDSKRKQLRAGRPRAFARTTSRDHHQRGFKKKKKKKKKKLPRW